MSVSISSVRPDEQHASATAAIDPLWERIREEVAQEAAREPALAGFLHATVLGHERLDHALAALLADKLSFTHLPGTAIFELHLEAAASDPALVTAARADIRATQERDPAVAGYHVPFLFQKGYQALQAYRIAHWAWQAERFTLARLLQSRTSEVFGVDIHPAARIGTSIFIDHATSVVVGETAVVGDNVSILHEVTLGGTGKESGDRHPKVGSGVLIGSGAKILGNVRIGQCSKVGAGSVVLDDVPPRTTVVGVPAVAVGATDCDQPSRSMDHRLPGDPCHG